MNLGRAQELLDAGRYDDAEAALGASEGTHSDIRQSIVLARIFSARGDHERALAEIDVACARQPDHVAAQVWRGIIAWDACQAEQSEAAFAAATGLDARNDLAISYHALTLLYLGRDAEAVALFRAHGFNDNRGFMVRLTEWMESQWLAHGRFFDPRQIEIAAGELPRGFLARRAAERRAQRNFMAKRYREMLTELVPLTTLPHPDEEVLFACALAAELVHDNERSLGYIGQLTAGIGEAELPDAVKAARARNTIRLRKWHEAGEDLNRVLIIGPEDYATNYYLGVLCLACGNTARARTLFQRSYGDYVVDTLEFQFWQINQALLAPGPQA
jgi:Flp pilus assembly protein TadD